MSAYTKFFERIPEQVLIAIGNGCNLGDKAFAQVMESDQALLRSQFMYGLRSRIHDKSIQMYLYDRLSGNKLVSVFCKNTGFGNRIVSIFGSGFSIASCHISERAVLPSPARYKLKDCENNPGKEFAQLNLFNPPYAKDYANVHFIITTFFDGMKTIPTLVLPDNSFSVILDSMPILAVTTTEETAYQERKLPQIISEVEKLNEQL
ncbi:hypothetical protein DSECCO2_335320 [anaerobic digester metagenome]